MAALKEGAKAPAFALRDENGKVHRLSKYKGQKVVLYFYPKDNTPGCTAEAQDFNKQLVKIQKKNATVIGVSPDNEVSHKKFSEQLELDFTLLADPDGLISSKYGGLRREDAVRREVQRHLPHHLHHRRDGRHREGLQGRQGGRSHEGRAEGALVHSPHSSRPAPPGAGRFLLNGAVESRASRGGMNGTLSAMSEFTTLSVVPRKVLYIPRA